MLQVFCTSVPNRYFGLLQLCFVVTLTANAWSPSACKHVFFFEPVGALISTVLSQLILGSRVYAIFSQNKIVGLVLGTTLLSEIIIGAISVSTTHPPPPILGPASSQPPCGAVMGPFGWLVAFWAIPLIYDTMAFLLTAWKAYDFWKREIDTPLFDIIWRDGVIYFFVIFTMNAANVIIFLTVPETLRAVNLTPTLVLEIILSCRLVLNLREAHGRSNSQPSSQPKWSDHSRPRYNNQSHNASSGEAEASTFEAPAAMKLQPLRKASAYEVSTTDLKVKPWNAG
ncbi:hypothetical protein GALMADRAFT_421382 [Galerina marginata CBS 339.88]|uniref:Uncharacterized protein n=1 Tax=Galerina marginata (strain CBS 339.88) TaxID=685588 RepID=A0A067T3U1_GALM3|nr:hypothetical protein GALMADRAFT_421382 [Galerina marginata CBS 339.88]